MITPADPPRRAFLAALGAAGLLALPGCASTRRRAEVARIVVVGGGYGGATAARYAALWGGDAVDVTLVERDAAFVSCPLSNLVLAGSRTIADVTVGYEGLAKRGVRVVHDTAVAVDPERRRVRLARGADVALRPPDSVTWHRLLFRTRRGLDTDAARATVSPCVARRSADRCVAAADRGDA